MIGDFDYEKLTIDDRDHIHGVLSDTTLKHIGAAGELLDRMPLDIAANPSQRLEVVHLEPAPTSKEKAKELAETACNLMGSPDFSEFIGDELRKQRAFLGAAKVILNKMGENISPVTNHAMMADVAIFAEEWGQHLDSEHWQEQNGLIISRGVTTISALGMAASELMQNAGHVFMSFPRTSTIEKLGIDPLLIDTNNKRMRKEVDKWLNQTLVHRIGHNIGKSMNVALSGKTDDIVFGADHKPEEITLARAGRATTKLFKKGYILPVVIWDGKGNTDHILELGELIEVKKDPDEVFNDIVRAQLWQAETLANRLGLPKDKVRVV
jgi:hypothetical protein